MHPIKRRPNAPAYFVVFILLSGILAACGGAASQSAAARGELAPAPEVTAETAGPAALLPTPTAEPTATTSPLPAEFDPQALGDATYSGILDQAVTLVDGRYEGEPFVAGGATRPIVTLLPQPLAYGDLDGDGRMDAAVVLAFDSGGSGTFIYLAAVESPASAPFNVATTLLGDREQVRSLTIDGGRLVVDLLSHAADDPACCPSLATIRTFRLDDGQLVDETAE